MNKKRRKELSDILSELQALAARLEAVRDEEQDAFDNMPESLQDGAAGNAMQEIISSLDDVEPALSEAIELIEGVVNA